MSPELYRQLTKRSLASELILACATGFAIAAALYCTWLLRCG